MMISHGKTVYLDRGMALKAIDHRYALLSLLILVAVVQPMFASYPLLDCI